MTAAQKLPAAYEEVVFSPRKPIVTLIGADLPHEYLDDAEPSELAASLGRAWARALKLVKLALVIALVGGYPAAMVASHHIDSSPVTLSQTTEWASPETGTILTFVGRELTGAGWAEDRPFWHPQSRLTALPAWQQGIIAALSDLTLLNARLAPDEGGNPDADLLAASRLLAPDGESLATPRLNAAAEALQRFDGRLSRNGALATAGSTALDAKLALFTAWSVAAQGQLTARTWAADAWPAARADIEAIYRARAHAHVAAQMLHAITPGAPDLIVPHEVVEAREKAISAWNRAAQFNPVLVSSQAGTGRFLSDHPAIMAFYISQAGAATAAYRDILNRPQPDAVEIAATLE